MSCNGNCGACSGCARELVLTKMEIDFLNILGQYAFLPVARKTDDPAPVYLEETAYPAEEYTLILECLEKKGLISVDYDHPLKNADYSAYAAYPIHGSIGLTARGQQVIELLEVQGTEGGNIRYKI